MKCNKSKIHLRSEFMDTKAVCTDIYGMFKGCSLLIQNFMNPIFSLEASPNRLCSGSTFCPLHKMCPFQFIVRFQTNTTMQGPTSTHTNFLTFIYITFLQIHECPHAYFPHSVFPRLLTPYELFSQSHG